jgi:hypothetical protein
MHGVGHPDILIDRGQIRLKTKQGESYAIQGVAEPVHLRPGVCNQIFTPFGISPGLVLRVRCALLFRR